MKVLGIITGIIMIILGVVAFFIPVQTFLGIGWVVGALMAIHGIELAIVGFSREKKIPEKAFWVSWLPLSASLFSSAAFSAC